MSDEEEQALEGITKYGKLFEVSKITTYRGYGHDTNEAIEVTIQDHGEAAGANRFHISAETIGQGPKRFATGNGGKTIDEALVIIHWQDLEPRSS